jgi:hypothetical protein
VEFTTPPHRRGLGTWCYRLAPSSLPTNGLVLLRDATQLLVHLSVRLAEGQQWLAPVIVADVEKMAGKN